MLIELWTRLCRAADDGAEGGSAVTSAADPAPSTAAASPASTGSGDAGEATAGDSGGAGSDAPAPPATAAAPGTGASAKSAVDWRDRRIAKLTSQLAQAREAAQAGGAPTPPAAPAPGMVPASEVDARAEARARELAAANAFNDRCNLAAAEGRRAFGEAEFNSRVEAMKSVLDPGDTDQLSAYNVMLDTAIETGKGPEILFRLGGDKDELARLLALPPVKMGLELARLALVEPPEPPTAAPKPIVPIGNRGTSHSPISPDDVARADNLSTAEWMKRREAQVKERTQA